MQPDADAQAKLRAVFDLSPAVMCITGLDDGRIREVNDAFLQLIGFDREDVMGRHILDLDLWIDPGQREEGIALLRAGSPVRDFTARLRVKGGEERVCVLAAELVTLSGEACILTALTDITDRTRAEEALRESERRFEAANRAKDEFLAMLGHELRNPLGTIINTVAVLDTLGADETLRRLTAIIGRQTRHLGRLVDDLLDVARVTSGKIGLRTQPVDLHELAARCLDTLSHAGRTLEHHVTLAGAAVHVDGDAARLEQVVNNLVDNALKYTPAGGAITIHTARDGTEAVLRVTDTGRGIHTDVLARVFELFVQEPQPLERARGGLGLGLTLVKRLVELHGGSVSAASAGPGQGSDFTVRLPARSAPDAGSAPPAGATPAAPPVRRRVLIVEDNPDARDSLRLLLEAGGHTVETSEDGRSGLAQLEAFRPDVALIDLGLPGIDGYALARLARNNPGTRDIRLVALTGYGQAEDQRRALGAGFDLHVTKPVDVATLQALLG